MVPPAPQHSYRLIADSTQVAVMIQYRWHDIVSVIIKTLMFKELKRPLTKLILKPRWQSCKSDDDDDDDGSNVLLWIILTGSRRSVQQYCPSKRIQQLINYPNYTPGALIKHKRSRNLCSVRRDMIETTVKYFFVFNFKVCAEFHVTIYISNDKSTGSCIAIIRSNPLTRRIRGLPARRGAFGPRGSTQPTTRNLSFPLCYGESHARYLVPWHLYTAASMYDDIRAQSCCRCIMYLSR